MNDIKTNDIFHYEKVLIEDLDYICLLESIDELSEKKIKKIESIIRGSFEYKNYITYIKDELDITQCSLLEGIDIKDLDGVSLELHHEPFNLYEITEILTKFIFDKLPANKRVSYFDIAKLVMEEHYAGNVGLVPLSATMHEAVHNNAIYIPASKIYGNYKKFIDKYRDFISIDKLERISDNIRFSETSAAKALNDKLKKIDAIKITATLDI